MGEAWLFLHPAEVEGWGLVIMEAAAQATPDRSAFARSGCATRWSTE